VVRIHPELSCPARNRRFVVHARVTFAQDKPEDIEDSARLFEEGIVPAARQEEGFRGALFLVRDDGTVMTLDLADSLDHLRANEKHGLYQAEVARFRNRIVGHPHREFFRVAVSKGIKGGVEMLEDAG
jgi:hypothetical protein